MQWGSLEAFLAMGGVGFYVWSAYGVAALVIVIELIALRRRHRVARDDVRRRARIDGAEPAQGAGAAR
jgi:heme exporter protein D